MFEADYCSTRPGKLTEMQLANYAEYLNFLPSSFRNQEWSTRGTAIGHICTWTHNPNDRITVLRMDTPSSPAVRTLVHWLRRSAQKWHLPNSMTMTTLRYSQTLCAGQGQQKEGEWWKELNPLDESHWNAHIPFANCPTFPFTNCHRAMTPNWPKYNESDMPLMAYTTTSFWNVEEKEEFMNLQSKIQL
jgi:hypothetical protein